MKEKIENTQLTDPELTTEELQAAGIVIERYEYCCMSCEGFQEDPGHCENCGGWVQRIYF